MGMFLFPNDGLKTVALIVLLLFASIMSMGLLAGGYTVPAGILISFGFVVLLSAHRVSLLR